ncbi:MAG TPA: alpha/beta hydrolase domain-containing protein, partial [Gemmatimonadales bacterium]|nr:alpha/beta hydrolase domain-containing protein [Gemmatimonadales bacterium]
PINSGPQHWVLNAAIAALDRWVRGGDPPPMAPRLDVAGDPPAYALDDLGNVRGGIRTPYVDAPLAVLSGLGQTGSGFCGIFGTTVCFDEAMRTTLYPTAADYSAAVNEATDRAVAAGFILEPDGALIKGAAAASDTCEVLGR